MKCEQAEVLMAELLAGEIRPEERAALEAHLVECAGCRGDFATARAGFQIEWPETAPSTRAVRSTLALVREAPAILKFLRFGTAAAAAFAAVLLILVSGGKPREVEVAAEPPTPPRFLASMNEAIVGSLTAKDEEGRPAGELGLQSHVVSIEILDGIAKTTVEENFRNHTDRRLEGTFRFPLPPDASISRLALEVNGKIEEGTCLEREKAREVFEGIVRRMKDPALLEWMPGGIFQCRIFPIEPRATKRVIVAYTQALPFFKGTMTYVYPLASEKTKAHPPEELRIDMVARFAGELRKIESPSHRLDVQRARPSEARASFVARNLRPENDFVLTMETVDDELRMVPHKVDGEDGYFALFLTPRGAPARSPGRYAFVLDVSASVTGPELEVARRVVRAMMERRIEGDRFEILAHHIEVERSGEVDLRTANDFMDRLMPLGGCDLLKALHAAPEGAEIVYIGGGTPTFGETDGAKILEAMKGRRIRTVGVGSRANAALLEKLGGFFRVSPNDDVNKRCAEIAATLGSPALSEIRVDGGDAVYDVVGLRDVFYGERLVVTGRYRGPAAKLVVTGRGYRRELDVTLPTKEEGNNYVRRLWAQRKIADLLALPDKKAEVTELGVKHQIMTPYTSFLVLESEQMWKDHQLKREVQKPDEVLGKATKSAQEETLGDRIHRLLSEGTLLYKQGKHAESQARFEEAFQLKPTSDQMYTFIKRAGEDVIAGMMNHPDRKIQDQGRRILELSKPGEHSLTGEAALRKYLDDLKNFEDLERNRVAFWHLKNLGSSAVKELIPALGEKQNDRYRSRVELLLIEMGVDASRAVAEALKSSDPFVRQQAAIVLGNIKDERTLPDLARLREDPNETAEVKKFVEEAIRKIDRTAPRESLDERAKAIRDAYDEQVRRERQLVTIRKSKAKVGEIVEEFRRQTGWNIVVDGKNVPDDLLVEEFAVEGEPNRKALEAFAKKAGLSVEDLGPNHIRLGSVAALKGLVSREVYERDLQQVKEYSKALERVNAEQRARSETRGSEEREAASLKDGPYPQPKWMEQSPSPVTRTFRSGGDRGSPATAPYASSDLRIDGGYIRDYDIQMATAAVALDPVARSRFGWSYGDFLADTTNPSFAVEVESIQNPLTSKGAPAAGYWYHALQPPNGRGFAGDYGGDSTVDEAVWNFPSSANSAYIPHVSDVVHLQRKLQYLQELGGEEVTLPRLSAALADPRELAREKKVLEERINRLSQMGVRTDVAPKKPQEGKVTAVAPEVGLVVISIGKDDGNFEGDEFTVYRGGDFVAKIQLDRADRRWAAGKIVLKKSDPRVGDDVSNHLYVNAQGKLLTRPAAGMEEVEVQPAGEGQVALKADGWTNLQKGRVFSISRDRKFVAIVRIIEGDGKQARAAIVKTLSIGQPQAGDKGRLVIDLGTFLATLPDETRQDLASRRSLAEMRVKMGY